MCNETIKEVAALEIASSIRKHADNIFVDYHGDEFAERFREGLRELAYTIENPSRYDPEPVCKECGEECGGDCE